MDTQPNTELDASRLGELVEELSQRLQAGQTIELEQLTDETLVSRSERPSSLSSLGPTRSSLTQVNALKVTIYVQ